MLSYVREWAGGKGSVTVGDEKNRPVGNLGGFGKYGPFSSFPSDATASASSSSSDSCGMPGYQETSEY